MKKGTYTLIFCLFALVGCQQAAKVEMSKADSFPVDDIKVDSNKYESYDYAGKTYAWGESSVSINDPSGKWNSPDYNFKLITSTSIKTELAQHGLKETEKSSDLVVSYGFDINMAAIRVKDFEGTNEKLVFNVPEGALTIVVIKRVENKVLWMGWATADYKKQPAAIAEERINYAVKEIFKKFPN